MAFLQVLYLASKDLNSSGPVQFFIASINALQLWIFPLRLITSVSMLCCVLCNASSDVLFVQASNVDREFRYAVLDLAGRLCQ